VSRLAGFPYRPNASRRLWLGGLIGRGAVAQCACGGGARVPDHEALGLLNSSEAGLREIGDCCMGWASDCPIGCPNDTVVLVRANGEDLARIADLMQKGRVRSLIDSRFPLPETRAALERSRSWRSRGKIVLEVI
jgi:NADPH:quinone reductase-like Zn-dependent oxidoreductase